MSKNNLIKDIGFLDKNGHKLYLNCNVKLHSCYYKIIQNNKNKCYLLKQIDNIPIKMNYLNLKYFYKDCEISKRWIRQHIPMESLCNWLSNNKIKFSKQNDLIAIYNDNDLTIARVYPIENKFIIDIKSDRVIYGKCNFRNLKSEVLKILKNNLIKIK